MELEEQKLIDEIIRRSRAENYGPWPRVSSSGTKPPGIAALKSHIRRNLERWGLHRLFRYMKVVPKAHSSGHESKG